MKSNTPAVRVVNLMKSFKIPIESSNGIKQKIINTLKGKKGYRVFTPLNDVSFTIEKGDFFGIVGRNGSGKSTLLKSIAGIYTPNSGEVTIEGTIVPFIELGVGFNPELTGRENVFLNGALLGFSHQEMSDMYNDIVDFAELGDFMDERLKNFSSGMQIRLAFSIAIRANGDILLLDEILAVGDAKFQQKCYDYFYKLKEDGKTVIFISHDMEAVQKFCNKAVYIRDGELVAEGKPDEIADIYLADLYGTKKKHDVNSESVGYDVPVSDFETKIVNKKKMYTDNDTVTVEFAYILKKKADIELRLAVVSNGIAVAHRNSRHIILNPSPESKKAVFTIDLKNFLSGNYDLNAGINDRKSGVLYASQTKADSFYVGHNKDESYFGYFKLNGEWHIDASKTGDKQKGNA